MAMDLVNSISSLLTKLASNRQNGRIVGFVPTMGALHDGHFRLIDRAREECQCVVVSVFVNPLQFDSKGDLSSYPRDLDLDLEICAAHGVDLVFAPSVDEIYPSQPCCVIKVTRLTEHLCGRYRPGHFQGVATVIAKLFQIVKPDRAYFGQKDAQQLAVIRRLVADFNIPVEIVSVPIVRDTDGLALSSRNNLLSLAERKVAISLYNALLEAERLITSGVTDVDIVTNMAKAIIPLDSRLRLEYLEIVDPDELQPVLNIEAPVLIAGSLWVGLTRLIDNVFCVPPSFDYKKRM
jgi:pantoate--beta-alanine ligase